MDDDDDRARGGRRHGRSSKHQLACSARRVLLGVSTRRQTLPWAQQARLASSFVDPTLAKKSLVTAAAISAAEARGVVDLLDDMEPAAAGK